MRPRKLFRRIYFHFLGVLVVVGITFIGAFSSVARVFLHQIIERQTRHAASLTASEWRDPAARAALVRRLSDELEIDVTVRTVEGATVAVSGNELPQLGDPEWMRLRTGPIIVGGRGFWYSAAPIVRDNILVGVLQSTPRRHYGPGAHMTKPALFVAGVLLIVGLGTAPLARRISRPVERLTEASRRFGSGELSYRVPVRCAPRFGRHRRRRSDELEELTRAWNDMADRVEGLVRGQKELLANVSHELRSPLARLRVALELLPRDAGNARLVDDIGIDIGELDRLIEDVLTMSRLEATGLPMRLDRVALRPLLEGLVARAADDPAVAGRQVVLDDGPAIELVADGGLLKRAVWNLIENAAKYGAPPIRIAAASDGTKLSLSVSDEGAGIASADRERVFAAFYRADKAHTPGTGGFGLGLALARRVADVHGGTIHVEPVRQDGDGDRGCRVVLEIPVKPA